MGRFNIEDRKVVTGIDLGTSCVRCVVGVFSSDAVELAGVAQVAHKGLSKGRIVNMRETALALQQVCEEAEVSSGLPINQLFLSLGGDYHIFSSQGMAIIDSHQVTGEDLNKAIETAKAVPLPSAHRLLHVLPKNFMVDGEGPFFNPLGLSGLRLETSVLMVSIADSNVQNALQCLRYAGYSARGLVLHPLATGLSMMGKEGQSSGLCILDIGQDQTSFIVILDSRINHVGSIRMGGEDFTHDLMQELQIPRDQAEELKLKTLSEFSDEAISDQRVSDQRVTEILTSRAELLFGELKRQLEVLHYLDLIEGGVVITGRGGYLPDLNDIGKSILSKPVRNGEVPQWSGTKDLSDKQDYATAMGILLYAQNEKNLDYRCNHLKGHVFKFKRWMQELLP